MWMFVFGLLYSFGTVLSFRAAVYEHVVISPDEPWRNFTRDEAFDWMLKNLEIFEEQTATAAQQVSLYTVLDAKKNRLIETVLLSNIKQIWAHFQN